MGNVIRKGRGKKDGGSRHSLSLASTKSRGSRLSLDDPIPSLDDIVTVRTLGHGSFGGVEWVIIHGESYALKKMAKARFFRNSDHSKLAWNERNAMLCCDSPFVLPLECCFQTDEDLYLLTPIYPGGDLLARLKAVHLEDKRGGRAITKEMLELYSAELLLAVEHMHKHNFCHRDIKPENIFIDAEGHLVMGDMGLAIQINPQDEDDKTRHWGQCGSYGYRSPECVRSEPCGFTSDIYSLGMTLYFFAYSGVPWSETKRRLDREALTGRCSLFFPEGNPHVTMAMQDLLRKMLEVDPDKRITVEEAKSHPALESIDWDKLERREVAMPWIPEGLPAKKEIKKMIKAAAKKREKVKEEEQRRMDISDTSPIDEGDRGSHRDSKATPSHRQNLKALTKAQQAKFIGFDNYEYVFVQRTSERSKTVSQTDSALSTPTVSRSPAATPPQYMRRLGVARSPQVHKRRLDPHKLSAALVSLENDAIARGASASVSQPQDKRSNRQLRDRSESDGKVFLSVPAPLV